VFYGRLLESYEVLIRDNKVESYRRDYPDVQKGFTVPRYRSNSGREFFVSRTSSYKLVAYVALFSNEKWLLGEHIGAGF
jgi:hypothetical protein